MGDSSISAPDEAVERVLGHYRTALADGLHEAVEYAWRERPVASEVAAQLAEFRGQVEYPLGWRRPDLARARSHPGKLLRPTLVLLACELAAARAGADEAERARLVERAIPAAACIELVHNFSLIHDDIEDGDEERRHRPTVWKIWGVPQAINTGDGLFSLARLGLWRLAERGVEPRVVVQLADLLDRTCLALCEGQFLDMRYEGQRDISVAMYVAMIERKTAALMSCAAETGARLGAPEDAALAAALARFGRALGVAFQLRDDLLGIWAASELGKSPAGDLRRKKMTLPILHALESASHGDRNALSAIYEAPGPASEEEIAIALGVLERAGARERVCAALAEESAVARDALEAATSQTPAAREARDQLATLVEFVTASLGG